MVIVTYHAIESQASPVCTSPAQLERDLQALRAAGCTFVSLDAVAAWFEGAGELPARAVALTFDDGYASVCERGLPILERLEAPATVFVIAGRVGGDNQWAGQWPDVPRFPLMDTGGLYALLAAHVTIGAHSWSHPRLCGLGAQEARREILDAGDHLEQLTGQAVRHFAYPYGGRDAQAVAIARRRYRTAVHASPGLVDRHATPHDLPRLDAHDLRVALRLGVLDRWTLRPYLAARRTLRQVRRRLDRHFA